MRVARAAMAVFVLAAAGAAAFAADKNKAEKKTAVLVLFKDGEKVKLKSIEVGYEESGLFGTSVKSLKKLPVKAGKLKLDVPIANLSKIEILSVDKKGREVKVRLTAADGKAPPLEGVVTHEKKLVWKGKHPFADSDVTLNPADIKEILLGPAAK